MNHQSYRDVIVTNNPALLSSGFSTDALAIGQIGIFLYDSKKDQVSVNPPNFSTTKAIQIIQGTPELPGNLLAAVANQSDRSKPIKGKKILSWSGRKAERGQNQIVTIGYDGVDATKTLTAKCEESKEVFIKLSGGPIDEIFHTEGKGYVRQYSLFSGCCDDCGDDCAAVSAENLADDLVKQINTDPIYSLGTRTGNKLIVAKKVSSAAAPVADTLGEEYTLTVADEGDDIALGRVQSFYPGKVIRRKSRAGVLSVYAFVQAASLGAPADFSNAGVSIISDCPACPSGYTAVSNTFVYQLNVADTGDAAALSAVAAQYGITGTETIIRVIYQFGQSTYIITSTTALTSPSGTNEVQSLIATGASSGTFTLSFDGETTAPIAFNASAADVQAALLLLSNFNPGDITAAGGPLPGTAVTLTFGGQYANTNVATITADNTSLVGGTAVITVVTPGVAAGGALILLNDAARTVCVITVPTTIAWVLSADVYESFNRDFTITLHDNVCGTSRLVELQDAYPDLVIAQTATGDCVNEFTTTIASEFALQGCPPAAVIWIAPQAYFGTPWTEVIPAGAVASFGVQIESVFVDRVTSECAYKNWAYDAEPIFIEVSQHSQDYNSKPTICASEWPVTEIQGVKLPIGVGSKVREQEEFFKGYDRIYWDANPIVRELTNMIFQAQPHVFYDQYTIAFEFDFHQSWFSEKLTDSYRLELYFPEGQGKQFEAAINSYIASVGIDLDPVVL
jgi:hypothetical protein